MKEKYLLHRPLDPRSQRDKTLFMVQLAVLVAISSVLVLFSFPLLPSVAFMEYDLADIPVLLCVLTMGTPAGLLVLVIAAAIQAFLMGRNGIIGFIMHLISSGVMVLVASGIYFAFKKSRKGMIIGLICSVVAVVLVMIPLNFIFIPNLFMSVPLNESAGIFFSGLSGGYDPTLYSEAAISAYEMVKGVLLVGIIPFNLIKYTLNSVLFYLLFFAIAKIFKGSSLQQVPVAPKAPVAAAPSLAAGDSDSQQAAGTDNTEEKA